jgi:hypothetical protein
VREITDKAYCYYLPAFLTLITLSPSRWVFSTPIGRLWSLRSHFSAEQIAAIIACLEYQAEFARAQGHKEDIMIDAIENLALKQMTYQAEMGKGEVE